MSSTQRSERFTFVVYKATKNSQGQELKNLQFVAEDPTIAYGECNRLNDSRSAADRYSAEVEYKVEKLPLISRRKTRHPFIRTGQKELFNPEQHEKDGNVDESKIRGKFAKAKDKLPHDY